MDTATVSVLVTGGVAGASIASGVWQHRRGLQHQRKLADLENVRGVLDDAAGKLHAVSRIIGEIRGEVSARDASWWRGEDGTKAFETLRSAGDELDALTARLSVRLGRSHAAVEAFAAAAGVAFAVYYTGALVRVDPFRHDPPKAEKWMQEQRENTVARSGRFPSRVNAFADEAQRTAGANLPPPGGRVRLRFVRQKPPAESA